MGVKMSRPNNAQAEVLLVGFLPKFAWILFKDALTLIQQRKREVLFVQP